MKESNMTNIKKLGLTALAGSLVATSGFAGAVDVSGTAKVQWRNGDQSDVTGNPYSMNQGLGFSGSGDLDNGMTIAYQYTMTNAAFSSSSLKLDMGDTGVISFSNGVATTGIGAYDDVMPTSGEEVWDDTDNDGAAGVVALSSANTWGYTNSMSGADLSISYNKQNGTNVGHSKSAVISSSSLMDNLEVGYGMADIAAASAETSTDATTMYGKYTMGGATFGVQMSDIDKSASNSDEQRLHYAVSFAINENLSASVGRSVVDFDAATKSDQENVGVAVSYTMGSMTVVAFQNSEENSGGTAASDDKATEVAISFAF